MSEIDPALVDLVCRQTSYTREEALEKLEDLKDPVRVIKAYMNPPQPLRTLRNTHQMIYHEISKFVEESSQQPLQNKKQ